MKNISRSRKSIFNWFIFVKIAFLNRKIPQIVLIDANDSFVHNIKDALYQLGYPLKMLGYSDFTQAQILEADALIFSPGPGHASEYSRWIELLEALPPTFPVLGICLGFQVLASYYGASLNQLREVIHGQNHDCLQINEHPLWKGIPNRFEVGRYHSWEIKATSLGDSLIPLAQTTDACLMAIAHRNRPHIGVQFHPESFMCPYGKQMFKNFIALIPWE